MFWVVCLLVSEVNLFLTALVFISLSSLVYLCVFMCLCVRACVPVFQKSRHGFPTHILAFLWLRWWSASNNMHTHMHTHTQTNIDLALQAFTVMDGHSLVSIFTCEHSVCLPSYLHKYKNMIPNSCIIIQTTN